MWQTVRFLGQTETFTYGTSKSCHNYTTGHFFQGKWTNDCGVRWLQSDELRSALQGKSFIFEGDSLVRQLFLRLIFHVRGIPEIVEHPSTPMQFMPLTAHTIYLQSAPRFIPMNSPTQHSSPDSIGIQESRTIHRLLPTTP